MTREDEWVATYCREILKRGMYTNRRNLLRLMDYVFRYTPLAGKDVLEFGGGRGVMSLYAAACGARSVLNLEPDVRHQGRFEELVEVLGYERTAFHAGTLQEFDPGSATYDVLLSHNSINHLDEEACIHLQSDPKARQVYMDVLTKLSRMARPGAHLIVADCSNRNVFKDLGLRNPFAPSIEWAKHQPPKVWAAMFEQTGWTHPRIRWTSPNTLGTLGRVLLGNPVASYLRDSHFCLVMEKPARAG